MMMMIILTIITILILRPNVAEKLQKSQDRNFFQSFKAGKSAKIGHFY